MGGLPSPSGAAANGLNSIVEYVQSGHEALPQRKKKKKGGFISTTDDTDILADLLAANGIQEGLNGSADGDVNGEGENGHIDEGVNGEINGDSGYVEGDEDHHSGDGLTNGGPVKPRSPPKIKVSPSEYNHSADSMPVSMDQLINGAKDVPAPSDPRRVAIEKWFSKQTAHVYQSITPDHRDKAIEHLFHHLHPDKTSDWAATIRQQFWRMVIRASFFWKNPETGDWVGKPKPIHRPDGVYENDYKVFVMCAAERLDRIGRDLPTPEWVKDIEDQVRDFLGKAEKMFPKELEHFAFMLLWDEEQKRGLNLEHMVERVKKAFGGLKHPGFPSYGCASFLPKDVRGPQRGRGGRGHINHEPMELATQVWEEAKAALR